MMLLAVVEIGRQKVFKDASHSAVAWWLPIASANSSSVIPAPCRPAPMPLYQFVERLPPLFAAKPLHQASKEHGRLP